MKRIFLLLLILVMVSCTTPMLSNNHGSLPFIIIDEELNYHEYQLDFGTTTFTSLSKDKQFENTQIAPLVWDGKSVHLYPSDLIKNPISGAPINTMVSGDMLIELDSHQKELIITSPIRSEVIEVLKNVRELPLIVHQFSNVLYLVFRSSADLSSSGAISLDSPDFEFTQLEVWEKEINATEWIITNIPLLNTSSRNKQEMPPFADASVAIDNAWYFSLADDLYHFDFQNKSIELILSGRDGIQNVNSTMQWTRIGGQVRAVGAHNNSVVFQYRVGDFGLEQVFLHLFNDKLFTIWHVNSQGIIIYDSTFKKKDQIDMKGITTVFFPRSNNLVQ